MSTAVFNCKHCQTPLGFSLGAVLVVGAVEFTKSVSLRCVKCSRVTFWTPEKILPAPTNNCLHAAR